MQAWNAHRMVWLLVSSKWTQAVSFAVKRGWNWTAHVVTVWEVMKANSSTGQNKLIIDPGDC